MLKALDYRCKKYFGKIYLDLFVLIKVVLVLCHKFVYFFQKMWTNELQSSAMLIYNACHLGRLVDLAWSCLGYLSMLGESTWTFLQFEDNLNPKPMPSSCTLCLDCLRMNAELVIVVCCNICNCYGHTAKLW